MARNAPDPRAMVLTPDLLDDLFGSMNIDVAASGLVDDDSEVSCWRHASHDTRAAIVRGRIAGCELTCAPPDDGLAALTKNDGVLSVSTRISTYQNADAAVDALRLLTQQVRAGHGPTVLTDIAAVEARTTAAVAEQPGAEIARFEFRYANPSAPEPHPVTLRFSIPPREWQEHWCLLHHEATLACIIIRFVGSTPDSRTTAELERRLLARIKGSREARSSQDLWMLDEETVADRFHVAYEASSTPLRQATRKALTDISRALPGGPLRIRLIRSPTMGEHNAGGLTKADGAVLLYVRLENLDLVPRLLKSILAHEIHHSVRNTEGPGREDLSSLLGTMVLEGLGTVFQLDVCPDIPIRYADVLDATTEAELWRAAQPVLHEPLGPLAAEWFFGQGQAPRWAGYTIGTRIVRGYLNAHPGLTAADLVTADAATILAGSSYAL